MEPLASIAAISGGMLVLLVLAIVILALLWQDREAQPLLLDEALRRQGKEVAHRAIARGGHDFAVAVQLCLSCGEAARCRTWLSSGARDGYQQFCPNAAFIERMKL